MIVTVHAGKHVLCVSLSPWLWQFMQVSMSCVCVIVTMTVTLRAGKHVLCVSLSPWLWHFMQVSMSCVSLSPWLTLRAGKSMTTNMVGSKTDRAPQSYTSCFGSFYIDPVLPDVCLVGLVVKASASRAEDPGFESRLRRDFFGVESYQWLKKWHSSGYPARRLAL